MKKTLLIISTALFLSLSGLAQIVKSIVADGEQGNGTNVGTFWYAYPNTTQGKSSTILIDGQAVDGVTDLQSSIGGFISSCISASGTLAKTAAPDHESAGIGFALAPIEAELDAESMITNSSKIAVDLSMAQGIEFYYKSTASKLILSVFTTDIKQNSGHDYFVELPAKDEWTKFTVAFPGSNSALVDGSPVLAQPSWLTSKTPWDGSKVFKLEFQVKDSDGNYSFSVDDIAIIGKEIANKVALSQAIFAYKEMIKEAGAVALQKDIDKLAEMLVVLNNPNASQVEVESVFEVSITDARVDLDIRVVNGKLQINNPTNKPVNIYNALGQKVSLENATKGMFIIQIGNQQQKVVL